MQLTENHHTRASVLQLGVAEYLKTREPLGSELDCIAAMLEQAAQYLREANAIRAKIDDEQAPHPRRKQRRTVKGLK